MSDETKKVKRGETVYAHVRGGAEEAKAAPEEDKKGGPSDVGEDDDLLVFRRGGITFHDLGTRLRSVPPGITFDRLRQRELDEPDVTEPQDGWWNEYVEIPLEAVAFLNDWRLFPDDILPMNDALLSGDPFGISQANGSGRKIPNCMPLPYSRAEWLHVDAVLYNNSGEARHVVGVTGQRPRNDQAFDAAPADEGVWKPEGIDIEEERWNPLNSPQGDNGVLKTQVAGKHLRVDSRLYYEGLDTGDSVKYVWTAEPSPSALEVEVPKMAGQRVRVFLRPRVQMVSFGYAVTAGAGTTSVNSVLVTRLPVYPLIGRLWRNVDSLILGTPTTPGQRFAMTRGFVRAMSAELERSQAAIDSRQAGEDFAETLLGGPITSRFNGYGIVQTGQLNEHNFYNPHEDPDPFFFLGAGPAALADMLVGAVEIKDTVYYAWLREDDQKNDERMDIWHTGGVEDGLSVSLPDGDWELTPQYLHVASDDDTAEGVTNTGQVFQEPIV